jgi:uncharacterized protein YyaL (SSP411 family)
MLSSGRVVRADKIEIPMSASRSAAAHRNRLADETSPYLRQHADNPVDWYPWAPEALLRARSENKPILLSIGYSACHWCHVMAHESFEDEEVANVMNRLFINIKVDREERPDIDQIYQAAHQLFNQRAGGWPLTIFLTPEQMPFFSGTYFPRTARYGLPGFAQLLERVAAYYAEHGEQIRQRSGQVQAALGRMEADAAAGDEVDREAFSTLALDVALDTLKAHFDADNGGFGEAPKFPHPAELEFALRRHAATGDAEARDIVLHTLVKMAEGGIHDHVGGGFFRYAVDATWTIPHFEKMLYDNGPLLRLYADAWCVSPDARFARVVEDTAAWLMGDMQSPEGGYYAALDADAEGAEGRYYVWSPAEVAALLSDDEYDLVSKHYGLDGPPNFEDRYWHLRVMQPLHGVAERLQRNAAACEATLASARAKLLQAREQRVPPARDEKILVSWNALAIRGMVRAAAVFGRAEWLDSARRALDFIRNTMWRDERLLASYKDGRAQLNAYLDDYAFLLAALIEMLQVDYRAEDLAFAEALAGALLTHFEDGGSGGFYFTSHDHEALFHRPKPLHDGATPSGNGIAAAALQRLGYITGEERFVDAAERTLQACYRLLERQPSGMASLLMALEEQLEPPAMIVLRGAAAETGSWRASLAADYRPTTLLLAPPADAGRLPPVLARPHPARGAQAYVCRGASCLAPVSSIEALHAVLQTGQIQ